jgi:hypothetical protein
MHTCLYIVGGTLAPSMSAGVGTGVGADGVGVGVDGAVGT